MQTGHLALLADARCFDPPMVTMLALQLSLAFPMSACCQGRGLDSALFDMQPLYSAYDVTTEGEKGGGFYIEKEPSSFS